MMCMNSFTRKKKGFAMYFAQDNKDVFSFSAAVIQRKKVTGALQMGMSRTQTFKNISPRRFPLLFRGNICGDI